MIISNAATVARKISIPDLEVIKPTHTEVINKIIVT
jgi:hypothetical protein